MPEGRRRRKLRTPEHVRADMSLHHVGYIVVKCGFTMEASRADYGYDASVAFYAPDGQVETGNVFLQLKATDGLERFMTARGIACAVDSRDFDLWADNPYPVYFILFDASTETAYWLYFQRHPQENGLTPEDVSSATVTVHLDPASRLDGSAVMTWRSDKDSALAQFGKVAHAQTR